MFKVCWQAVIAKAITAYIFAWIFLRIRPKFRMWSAKWSNMWSNRFYEVLCAQIERLFEAGFRPQNARKWAISGEKQRKKEILANLLFGLTETQMVEPRIFRVFSYYYVIGTLLVSRRFRV